MTTLKPTPSKKALVPLSQGMWWFYFALASFILSLSLQAFRVFTVTPDLKNGLYFALTLVLLAITFGVLLFDSYAKDRAEGKVKHSIQWFERLLDNKQAKQMP